MSDNTVRRLFEDHLSDAIEKDRAASLSLVQAERCREREQSQDESASNDWQLWLMAGAGTLIMLIAAVL